jgi:GT2 family glycosyltransferase
MTDPKPEAREQRCQRHVQEAVESLNRGYGLGFRRALAKAVELGCSVRNLNLLRAMCIGIDTLPLSTIEALEQELLLFPDNVAARNGLADCSARISGKREPVHQLPDAPLFSLVLLARKNWRASVRPIRAALFQPYPKIEVIVVGVDVDDGFERQLSALDPRVRPLAIPQCSDVEALQHGLHSARGDYHTVIPDDSYECTCEGLKFIARFLQASGRPDFVCGIRMYLDRMGLPQDMRVSLPRWSRSMVLDERNFESPTVVPRFSQMVWSRALFERVGGSLNLSLKEAYDYEICCRFMRYAKPVTLPVAVCVGRPPLDGLSDALTPTFVAEALQVARDEKRERPLLPSDSEVSPPYASTPAVQARTDSARRARTAVSLSPDMRCLVEERGPTISIVTPSFNQGQFLEETIDSILSQGYPRLEYIIIDGGSTDGSVEIIRRYARHLHYWCSAPDAGQYFAIQKGLARTSGEVMTWLNSDDRYAVGVLWAVAAIFMAYPNVRWLTGLHAALKNNGIEEVGNYPEIYSRASYLMEAYDRPFVQQEGTFWRRSLWEQAGSSLDLRFSLAADFDLWRRFFRHAQLHTAQMPIGFFRQHETQRSQLFLAEYHREAYRGIQEELALIQRGIFTEMLELCPVITGGDLERALRDMLVA